MQTAVVKRAILSVSDKTGIVELGQFLASREVEILSTGGTADHLSKAGVPVTKISEYSGAPEILGGRVKTLTPKVFGGILFDRSQASHQADCARENIPPIDLVVVNLYPFEATIRKPGVTVDEAIEQIDVGGPSMLRAAAKNHKHVLPLCDPALYGDFMREMESGTISDAFRRRAAVEVFRKTAAYDAMIAAFLGKTDGEASVLPHNLEISMQQVQPLRYGENPQQAAAFYASSSPFEQLQGKELSYNNILDLDAAFRVAFSFSEPACAVIKHTNPCGVATAADLPTAVRMAIAADSVSAFGGIIGLNRELDSAAVEQFASLFLEVVVAPSITEEAKQMLTKKKNLRVIVAKELRQPVDYRSAAGGILAQAADSFVDAASWKTVTKRQVTDEERRALEFAWKLCASVKSNAIVLTRGTQSVGVGAGQMSRVDSAKIAVMKATQATQGCVAASDAFFPFRDGLDILIDAGVVAVVQPGGSVRDDEVIAAADERGISMVFTGERHFRH